MICAKNRTNWEKGESLGTWVVQTGLTEEEVSDLAYLCRHFEINSPSRRESLLEKDAHVLH